jgi:hypothetical protein
LVLTTAAEEPAELTVRRLPSAWFAAQEAAWAANGITGTWLFPDLFAACWPGTDQAFYLERLPETPLTRAEWTQQAATGQDWPAARRPFRRLAVGAMLYDSYIRRRAAALDQSFATAADTVFAEMHELGLNAVVLCCYLEPEEWADTAAAAARHDLDLIIQYHAAYFQPARGRAYYERHSVPRAREFLAACAGSERLLGFAVKEEVDAGELPWLQEYLAALRRSRPDAPLYILFNGTAPMDALREPRPDVAGTDIYPFLGAYFGGGRQRPTFYTPQRALTGQLLPHLRQRRDAAMRTGAVFTYTPDMQPGGLVRTETELVADSIPTRECIGQHRLADGRWLLWRRYAPPGVAMRAAVWVAAACGAQGWFPWFFVPTPTPGTPAATVGDPALAPLLPAADRPIWQDYVAAAAEVRRHEALLLQARPSGFARGRTADPLVVAETLRQGSAKDMTHLLVLVNLDLGRWGGHPAVNLYPPRPAAATPAAADAKPALDIDPTGQLVGFEPLTAPRRVCFQVRLRAGETVRDCETGTPLTASGPAESGWVPFEMDILPGSGRVLGVGSLTDARPGKPPE